MNSTEKKRPTGRPPAPPRDVMRLNTIMPRKLIQRVDAVIARREVLLTRTQWLTEAIIEKLAKEEEDTKVKRRS